MDLDICDQTNPGFVVLGLGCERGTESGEVIALAERALSMAAIGRRSLRCIASLDIRAAEPALLAAAAYFGVPFQVFDAATLEAETLRLQNPSDIVFALTGCHGVAEAAALASAQKGGSLIVPKMKSAKATAAVATCFIEQVQPIAPIFPKTDSASLAGESSDGLSGLAGLGMAS